MGNYFKPVTITKNIITLSYILYSFLKCQPIPEKNSTRVTGCCKEQWIWNKTPDSNTDFGNVPTGWIRKDPCVAVGFL